MIRCRWQGLIGLALGAVVVSLSGCIKLDARFAVRPDMNVAAKITVGVDARMAQQGGMTEMPFSGLSEKGGDWKVREYEADGWKFAEVTGLGKAGEGFMGEGEGAPTLEARRTERRLTTRYWLRMTPPAMPADQLPGTGGSAPAGDAGAEGLPDMKAFAESMMAGLDLKFGLAGPGRLVRSTGRTVGEGAAEWTLGVTDLAGDKSPDMVLETETINWTHLGRLADQIVALGGPYDAGTRLAAALGRGLVPNPPANAAGDKLTTGDYLRLLEIIGVLDTVLAPEGVAEVLAELDLSSDGASGTQIKMARDRAMRADFAARTEQTRRESITRDLKL